jgi:hypothetical protein
MIKNQIEHKGQQQAQDDTSQPKNFYVNATSLIFTQNQNYTLALFPRQNRMTAIINPIINPGRLKDTPKRVSSLLSNTTLRNLAIARNM